MKYGEIKKLNISLEILTRNKLNKIKPELEEKEEKTKTFNKILEDKFHTLQTFKNIMITFHQQLEAESKKTEGKRLLIQYTIILFLFRNKIKILEIILEARKKRVLYELCYIFFNPISFKIFHPIKLALTEGKDEEINTSYGYLALLLNLICKYLYVNQRYLMIFKGSRSFIKKSNTEILNLFINKSNSKIDMGIACLMRNCGEILNFLKIDKKFKENELRNSLEIICNFLYYGEFKEPE